MRPSNVIMCAILAIILGTMAMIPILYNLEYKGKLASRGAEGYSRIVLDSGKVIMLEKVDGIALIPFDSLIVEVKTAEASLYEITSAADTVSIRGKGEATDPSIILFLPKDHSIMASNSRILIRGDLRMLHPPSYQIVLNSSVLYSKPVAQDLRVPQALGHLTLIDHGNSTVEFRGRMDIEHLTMRNVSSFNCSRDVHIQDTDFAFDNMVEVRSATCREGLYVDSR